MADEGIPDQRNTGFSANLAKVGNFFLATEFIWLIFAACLVHAAIFLNWPTFLPWLILALALAYFPVRLARSGRLTQRTPFDIPIVLFLISVILGIVVSPDRRVGVGALQSFLVLTAAYYSLVNYPAPVRMLKIGFPFAIAGLIAFFIIAPIQANRAADFPSGLGIGAFIVAAIAIGVVVFRQRLVLRVISGLFASALIAVVLVFTHSQGSLGRLFLLSSIKVRMIVRWFPTLELMTGSHTWTGLGLGCWPLESGTINFGGEGLHVHSLYLEIYANLGVPGMVAFVCALAAGAKVCADILYSDRKHPWYGFGAGVVLACVVTLALGFIESAPFGMPAIVGGVYHYLFSPIPCILAVLLVTARRLLREEQPALEESREHKES